MKRFVSILLFLALILVTPTFAAESLLRVGIRPDNRTIEYATDDNTPAGVLVELWKHWGQQQGRTVEFVFVESGAGPGLLENGQIDVLGNSHSGPGLELSAPYFSYDFYLFSNSDSQRYGPHKFPLAIGVRQVDLDYLNTDQLSGAQVKSYHTYVDMLDALRTSEIDYFLANDVSMNVAVNGLELLQLNYPSQPFLTHHVRAAVLTEKAAFLTTFNPEMAQTTDFLGDNVTERWIPGTAAFRMSWSLIGLALVIVVVSILIIVIWFMNAKLKEQVSQATLKLVHDQKLLREAHNKAVDNELYIRNLLDAIHAFVIAINDVGKITHVNSYAKRFVLGDGPCRNQLYRSCFPFLSPYRDHLIDVFEGKKTFRLRKVDLRLNSDEQIVANLSMLPFVVDGKSGALILIEDISEAAKNDELLLQSQKFDLIQSLAGGVAHDFNNILAIISGSANLLNGHVARADKLDKEKVSRYLENILTATDKGVATTKGLASLSGRASVEFEQFSMNHAVENIIHICTTTMDKSVQVQYVSPQQSLVVNGNRGLLEQAIINVVINAYHAMTMMRAANTEHGGKLTISLELSNSHNAAQSKELCLVIKDSGVGIPDEHISRVFTPFFTTKKSGRGTGLGLAMVHNSLTQHKGRVEISSTLGLGTDVRLFLPCIISEEIFAPEGDQQRDSAPSFIEGKDGLVMLADDNELVRDSLSENLSLYGYRVIQARNGVELVDLFSVYQNEVDVIITDLEMPEMTGDQAFYSIRNIDPEAKVIISSGFLEDERIANALHQGVDDYIQKPCVVSELVAKIETLKGQNSSHQVVND